MLSIALSNSSSIKYSDLSEGKALWTVHFWSEPPWAVLSVRVILAPLWARCRQRVVVVRSVAEAAHHIGRVDILGEFAELG